MSESRWLATGNFFTSYKAEQRIFLTHIDRLVFICFLAVLFVWPLVIEVGNKYMLVIDSILIAIVAIYGLNLLTGFAGLISIGHAAFVGVGAYTLASFRPGSGQRPRAVDPFLAVDDHCGRSGGRGYRRDCRTAVPASETSLPGDRHPLLSR